MIYYPNYVVVSCTFTIAIISKSILSLSTRLLTFTAAVPFSASKFLEPYEDEFLKVVDAKQNLLKLKIKKVISDNVKTKIEGATEEDAKYILLEHLQKNATQVTLGVYCDVAIAADGYAQMQEVGKKMMAALPAEGELGLCWCVRACGLQG